MVYTIAFNTYIVYKLFAQHLKLITLERSGIPSLPGDMLPQQVGFQTQERQRRKHRKIQGETGD